MRREQDFALVSIDVESVSLKDLDDTHCGLFSVCRVHDRGQVIEECRDHMQDRDRCVCVFVVVVGAEFVADVCHHAVHDLVEEVTAEQIALFVAVVHVDERRFLAADAVHADWVDSAVHRQEEVDDCWFNVIFRQDRKDLVAVGGSECIGDIDADDGFTCQMVFACVVHNDFATTETAGRKLVARVLRTRSAPNSCTRELEIKR